MNEHTRDADSVFLIIDDDAVFCSVMERALSRRGYAVHCAYTGKEALELARRIQPGHTILDLNLNNESGLNLIKPLLAAQENMRIVVLTGYGSISTAVLAIKQGARNYLAKPVNVETLLASFEIESHWIESQVSETESVSLRRIEWEHIQRALQEHDGNLSATARSLGLHRRTLQRKLQKRPVKR